MIQNGAKMSRVDPAVFYWVKTDGDLHGVLACHVDDFIWGGSTEFANTVIDKIRSTFMIGREDMTLSCMLECVCYM